LKSTQRSGAARYLKSRDFCEKMKTNIGVAPISSFFPPFSPPLLSPNAPRQLAGIAADIYSARPNANYEYRSSRRYLRANSKSRILLPVAGINLVRSEL